MAWKVSLRSENESHDLYFLRKPNQESIVSGFENKRFASKIFQNDIPDNSIGAYRINRDNNKVIFAMIGGHMTESNIIVGEPTEIEVY